jgi:hypothetical protein
VSKPSNVVIDKIRQREVAGVFGSPNALDAAVKALLHEGFDRADISFMASPEAVREKLGDIYVATEELPDVPRLPRPAYVARDDVRSALSVVAGVLGSVGVAAAAFGIVASGGALALALGAAALGGAGAVMTRLLGRERAEELERRLAEGGLILWVRVRSPEREERAQQTLRGHGAEAVRVHEMEIEKTLQDIPLSSLLVDEYVGKDKGTGKPDD